MENFSLFFKLIRSNKQIELFHFHSLHRKSSIFHEASQSMKKKSFNKSFIFHGLIRSKLFKFSSVKWFDIVK